MLATDQLGQVFLPLTVGAIADKLVHTEVRVGYIRKAEPCIGLAELLGHQTCLLYTSPSPRDVEESRMPSSA